MALVDSSAADDECYDDVRSVDDPDEVGSLVDFVVDEEDEEPAAAPTTNIALDGIDAGNVITGKRKRKQTQFYEQEVFASAEFKRMLLEDVPPSEYDAALGDDDEDDDEEEEDADYKEEEEDEDDDDEDDEDEDDEDDDECETEK